MKKLILLFVISFFSMACFAQGKKLYNPQADAAADIEAAVKKAAAENKFVILQGGGKGVAGVLNLPGFAKQMYRLIPCSTVVLFGII